MASVFVSHSKLDEREKNFFSNVAAKAGFKTYMMEWESLANEYSGQRIADIIRSRWIEDVRVVVVLLGQNLQYPPSPQYTHNWVNFEVGVASGANKPVMILEPIGINVEFPIPWLTDYYQYEFDNVSDLQKIGEIIQYYITNGFRKTESWFKCPNKNCNAEYHLWKRYNNYMNCPSCRTQINFQ